MDFLIYNVSWPFPHLTPPSYTLESQHASPPLSRLLFFWPSDSNKGCSNMHMYRASTSTWATYQWPHTWRRPPPTPTSHQLPKAPYLGKEFMSLCLVRAGLLIDMILGMSFLGHHYCCTWVCEGNSQVMSRRQHFATLCDSFRLLCSFIPPLQLCSVGVGYRNIDFRTEYSIVTILNALTI